MPNLRWTKVPGVWLGAALLGLAGPAPAAERTPLSLSLNAHRRRREIRRLLAFGRHSGWDAHQFVEVSLAR